MSRDGNWPTIRQLQYFVALADTKHFRAAALRCRVSPSALSLQIQALERTLGVRLFERSRAGTTLTPAGEGLVGRAQRVLGELDALSEAAAIERGPMTGPLRLGVIPTISPYLLPKVMPTIRETFPDLELHLREDLTDPLLTQLYDGVLELLLLAVPLPPDSLATSKGRIEILPLENEPFVLASGPQCPLRESEVVDPRDLCQTRLLLLEEGHCLRQHVLEACHSTPDPDLPHLEATSLPTLIQMVASGLGSTLLPAFAVDVEARADVRLIRFTDPVPVRSLAFVWRVGSPRGADYRALGRVIAREAAAILERWRRRG